MLRSRLLPILIQAALEIGSLQIRSRGTIGGNPGTAPLVGHCTGFEPTCRLWQEFGDRMVPLKVGKQLAF